MSVRSIGEVAAPRALAVQRQAGLRRLHSPPRYRHGCALARRIRSHGREVRCAPEAGGPPTKLRTDRTYRYPFTVAELWERLQRVDAYTTWWPWLRDFDGRTLAAGEVWTCTVQPPLPYAVRFSVAFDEVVEGEQVVTTIGGDIGGTATLQLLAGEADPGATDDVADAVDGSRLRLIAELAPQKRSMLALSVMARPLVTFGHHWVLDTGARQFAEGLGGSLAPRRPGGNDDGRSAT